MISQNLDSKLGSLESLKVRVRCGFRSFLDHSCWTRLLETPACRAMLRTLQRLRFLGGRVTSLSTVLSFPADKLSGHRCVWRQPVRSFRDEQIVLAICRPW